MILIKTQSVLWLHCILVYGGVALVASLCPEARSLKCPQKIAALENKRLRHYSEQPSVRVQCSGSGRIAESFSIIRE